MRNLTGLLLAVAISGAVGTAAAADDPAALARALLPAKATLEAGLQTSEREGQPISGKFEIEDGKLQLSVYTIKNGAFSEIVLDPMTGAIVKTEKITEGEDLKEAKEQSAAMATAKRSLRAATETALAANPGARAVSIIPAVKDGRPVGQITLLQSGAMKTITSPLD
jgi:hypothetical protein